MHGSDTTTTAIQRPPTSSNMIPDTKDSPPKLDAVATHPVGWHTERTPQVTVFGGPKPSNRLPSRSEAGPKSTL